MMSQFGKNPPWARGPNDMGGNMGGPGQPGMMAPGVAAPVGLGQPGVSQPVYSVSTSMTNIGQAQFTHTQMGGHMQQPGMQPGQQQQQAGQITSLIAQPGVAMPTSLASSQVTTVAYPTPRAAQQTGPQPKQRVFTGTVTKLHDNFGFVDEDVFFQSSCVKGSQPKVGDRVLVEATYNANMPFKWNATRIQVLPNQMVSAPTPLSQATQQAQSLPMRGGAQIPPPQMPKPTPLFGNNPIQSLMGNQPNRSNMNQNRNRDRGGDRGGDRDRERGGRPDRGERRKRSRSPSSSGFQAPKRRSRSPRRSPRRSRTRSPVRRQPERRARVIPRYMVQVPKLSLDTRESNVISLKSRYQNLYIPSDFFNSSFEWVDAFPAHRPFNLGNNCAFHVMHKEVHPTVINETPEPTDADHLFSAKVMLLSNPAMEEIYHKTCALAEDSAEVRDVHQHPTRLLNFLVGLKGKNEPMAIGGPWSPSLDGEHPVENPAVLIKTAIRTTRALTGIDLSACTTWYRFAEIRYHRPEEMHKGRVVPARVETVVLYLPDVWSCMPSRADWTGLQQDYKTQLTDKLGNELKLQDAELQEGEDEEEVEDKKDPTHYSELDPKTMKVGELRRELDNRTINSKGLRSQLVARLMKALKTEQEKEEEEADDKEEDEDEVKKAEEEEKKKENDEKEEEKKKKEEEDKKRKEERERTSRERRYQLPENPAIIVHPSPTAKQGKFDCTVMSLSVLLDYRPEDNKEHSFEVSLFAELFNEMLMRDYSFRIYRALLEAPEKKKDEKKKRKDEKSESEGKDEKKGDDKEGDEKSDDKDAKDKDTKDKDTKDKDAKDKDVKDKDVKDKDVKEKDVKDKDGPPDDKKRKSSSEDKDDKEDKKSSKSEDGHDNKDGSDDDDDDKNKRKERKYVTVHRDLLLAFVYFDQTHTGYILDKDMEEILHTTGLHLSRAQIKKLVAKCVARDTLKYRQLTDQQSNKQEGEVSDQTDAVKPEDAEKMDTSVDISVDEMGEEEVALGNKALLPTLVIRHGYKEEKDEVKEEVKEEVMDSSAVETPRSSGRRKNARGKTPDVCGSGDSATMVSYKGSMVDIKSIMQRLEKSEKTRTQAEDKLRVVSRELGELKGNFSSNEKEAHKVSSELSDLKKKLREEKKMSDSRDSNAKKYRTALESVRQQMFDGANLVQKTLGEEEYLDPQKTKTKSEIKTEVNGS